MHAITDLIAELSLFEERFKVRISNIKYKSNIVYVLLTIICFLGSNQGEEGRFGLNRRAENISMYILLNFLFYLILSPLKHMYIKYDKYICK